MKHDLIGSKEEMYNKLQPLNKIAFINEFDKLMIDGKWGSEKSYFIEVIKNLASEKNIRILVVDTWKLEYLQNPERMIMLELLSDRTINVTSELSNFLVGEVKELFQKYITEINDEDTNVEKLFKRGIKTINKLKENSNELEYLELLDQLAFDQLDDKLLRTLEIDIIIFDELDRVLPETFIEIIKFMKYFTNRNQNFAISAALNLEQCNSMIKHIYGEHFSSEVYLDKVFEQELEIINYFEEKAIYIYNLIDMPSSGSGHQVWTIKQTICNYYKRGLREIKGDNVGFGFKSMELRDIANFVENDLKTMTQEVWWNNGEYEQNLTKVMTIFYMMYNEKYYKNINSCG